MIRDTSREAYHLIKDMGILSHRRLQVYEALIDIGPATATQIAQKMPGHKSMSVGANVHARLGELVKMNLVEEIKEADCPVTQMRVIYWDVKAPSGYKKIERQKTKKDLIYELQLKIKDLELSLANRQVCFFCYDKGKL